MTLHASSPGKWYFIHLFDLLNSSGKLAFISGPIPTLVHGVGCFSQILSLHTWLQSACCSHNIGFIHNFDLFWDHPSFFARDGLRTNKLGSRMLAAIWQYRVLSSPLY